MNGGNLEEDSDSLCRYVRRETRGGRAAVIVAPPNSSPESYNIGLCLERQVFWELMNRRKDPAISFLHPVIVSQDGPRF